MRTHDRRNLERHNWTGRSIKVINLNKIKIGYEIGTGEEVNIPLAHTVVTGLTQEAGKTTCIMAMIKRSGFKAVIIKTKIGEKAITEGTVIPPFYKEDFDWEYASELLESSRQEKLKFERSWIIKYCKNANNLLEFKRNIDNALAGNIRELERSVLITLQAYLEKILPDLQYAPLSKTLDIREGINIMDLERFKEETQSLIIRSVLNEVLTKEKKTIIIIPECWKYIPEKFATPVKRPSEKFVREGATNHNYLWLDSQDITGVSKVILKQCSNWILGYQREINEIERTIDQIPLNKKNKPKSEDIATLKLGQFYVATSDFTKKVYVQPSWMQDEIAIEIAKGLKSIADVQQPVHIAPYQILPTEEEHADLAGQHTTIPAIFDGNKKINELREDFIQNRNDFFNKFGQINESLGIIQGELYKLKNIPKVDENEIMMRVLQKMPVQSNSVQINKEALILELLARIPKGEGNVIYEVAPLEKIKKDFLQQAKDKILIDCSDLNEKEKKMLKYIETQNKEIKTNEIITKSWLISDGSSARVQVSQCSSKLVPRELIKKGTHGGFQPNLKNRIRFFLETHGATEQEIEQVYNHILMKLLEVKNE